MSVPNLYLTQKCYSFSKKEYLSSDSELTTAWTDCKVREIFSYFHTGVIIHSTVSDSIVRNWCTVRYITF